jgi:hypothetical protein
METHIVVFWAVAPCSLVDRHLDPENEAACSSETFLSTYRTTQCHIQEHRRLNGYIFMVIKLIMMTWSAGVQCYLDENYIQNYRKICKKDTTLQETDMDIGLY